MADDFHRMCSLSNLKRAYRWIQSNPEAFYKNFSRDAYTAYAAASQFHLRRLQRDLQTGRYEPSHATKVYVPKPSGLLRGYSILDIDDQIVYQACANIIADKLKPKVKGRYNNNVFGHLYAGKRSKFFYLKWQDGYKDFGRRIVHHIEHGNRFVANFDLTAFYDSIDYEVLKHFLLQLKVEEDLVEFLLQCLETWTSNNWPHGTNAIYHRHGIPQGPLSSGLIAEVVLKYLDDKGIKHGARYLRYVDDIKIFAKSESTLRQRLISLDLASKDVGLFPQAAKVEISEVSDPYSQVKSVSNPPEPSVRPAVNQRRLQKRLLELTRRGRVGVGGPHDAKTRFKYLLSQAMPHSRLNQRLMQVLRHEPSLSANIAGYIERYNSLPSSLGREILKYLSQHEIYHAVNANLLNAVLKNSRPEESTGFAQFCHTRLFKKTRGLPPPQPTYKVALWSWVLVENKVSFREFERAVKMEVDSWVVKELVTRVRVDAFGAASLGNLLNWVIKSKHNDAARMAALRLVVHGFPVEGDISELSEAAKPVLFVGKKIRVIGNPQSLIASVLGYVFQSPLPKFDWRKFLGNEHEQAELLALNVKSYWESSIDACMVALDSFFDLIFSEIYAREKPGKNRPAYGTALRDPHLIATIPKTCAGFTTLHELRIQSLTAHPKYQKTGTNARRLKHADFRSVKAILIAAIEEISSRYT